MKHFWIVPALLLPACAEGGGETRPQSQVPIQATHHMYALKSLPGFGSFPVPSSAVQTDRGYLHMSDDSTYAVERTTGTSGSDYYALADDGTFSVYVTGSSTEPSVVFLGGYSLVANEADYFFTDRVSTPNSQKIGLFYGTPVVSGQVELEGEWHLLSLHVVFDQTTIPSPDNVGRGSHGALSVAAGAAGDARAITGNGSQGTSPLTFGGSIQNLLVQGVGDGTLNLTIDYQLDGQSADARIIQSAATDNVVFGVDEDSGDGEAGLVTLVRKFDTSSIDPISVQGTFLVGGHTLFVNPSNPGSDTFVGVVILGQPTESASEPGVWEGAFHLDATGNTGADFVYQGTYDLDVADDGGMTLSIDGTTETWFAAIDRSYNTFVFIDDFEEVSPTNSPELNFGFGIRKAGV